jgi:hypothetical protein
MSTGSVARDAVEILRRGAFPDVPAVDAEIREHGHVIRVWLTNGYGVSLVTCFPSELPDLLIIREGDGDWEWNGGWDWDAPVSVTVDGVQRTTDAQGGMSSVAAEEVAAVLRVVKGWNGGRHWSMPLRERRV